MVGCGTATPLTPTATLAPSATPSALPSATPTSAPVKPTATVPTPTPVRALPPLPQSPGNNICPDTQPSMLMPGRQGRVSTTSAATNRVRSEPSTAGALIGEIPAGEYFDVLTGPECAHGQAWFQVRTERLEGWMAEGSADEYWVQPILTEAQNVSGPNIQLPGFEFALPEAVGSKTRVSHLPYDPETRTPPVSSARFADYLLPNANAVIYVYPVEDYLYYRSDQRVALEQIRTAINTLLTKPGSQVSLPSVIDSFRLDNVRLTQAGAFKDGFGLHAVAMLSPADGSAKPKPYYVFFGYSSDMKYLIFAKLDVNPNFGQFTQASTTDFTPGLSLLDEIFRLDIPDKCEMAAIPSDNLAYQKPARASASLSAEPPAHAVDQNNSTVWSAGSHAPQWIEIDLGQVYHITEVRLMVEQWPEGDTVHVIRSRSAGAFVHLHTFRQKTSGCDWLIFTPEPAIAGIQIIRIDTLSSPSWVAWREIQVYGEVIPSRSSTPVPQTLTPGPFLKVETIKELTQPTDLQIALAFSPNGEQLSSAGWDSVIRIWEVSTGALVKEIPAGGNNRYVGALAFSPDGQKIASGGSDDKVIKLWDTSTGALIATLKGHTSAITTLDFSPDGRLLASGSCCSGSRENSVRIWSAENYEELHLVEFRDEPIMNVAFSPDGHLLAVAARDGRVKLWDIADWSEYKTLNSSALDALLFADEGETLIGASRDNSIWIWSVPGGEVLRFLEGHTDWVSDISLSSDGRLLASAGRTDMTLRIWDWQAGRELWQQTFDKNARFVTRVAFSPVRNYLAVCVGSKVILLEVSY